MSRRMLINARTPEEVRVAVVDGDRMENYQVEVAERGLTRGNIYRGVINAVQPSLNAAFVDYGAERNGFLAIQDVVPEAYYHEPAEGRRARIEEVLEKGRPIIVQVTKDAERDKGATLTTNLSLAGRYLVLKPFDDTVGVSRKVEDDDTRRELKELAQKLDRPDGCGVIIRTNALDQNKTALNRDLTALLRLWKRVRAEARQGRGTQLIYSDQDLIVRALRDYLDSSIHEVLADDDRAYQKSREYMRAFMPRSRTRLVRYQERTPLFSRFKLEDQIESIYERRVELPSGGSIVIEPTEALVSIDVNSGRSTGAASQEETAVKTNLEAAPEVARQLRLRDIGGLVVVDFIDMRAGRNRRQVEKAMREALKSDRARTSVGRLSSNGLLEVNRQRLEKALHLRTHRACPTCKGTGRLASPEMVGLTLLRMVEARAAAGNISGVRIALHPELADAVQNGRRRELAALEQEFGIRVEILASTALHRSDRRIEWASGSPGKPDESERQPAAQAAESRAKSGARRPSRRRRGRRSGAAKDEAQTAATEAAKPASEPAAGGDGKPQSSAKSRSRRRRRSRRGSRKASPATAAPDAGGAEVDSAPAS